MPTADGEQDSVWRDYYLGVQSVFYLAQGVAMGSLLYLASFIRYLDVDDFGSILFQAVIWLPWYLKVFFGVLSDNVPVRGYGRRKPYMLFAGVVGIIGWITIPLLSYVLNCQGIPLSGNWVPLRELKGGADWWRLFGQRCEKPLKQIADKHTDLFEIMIDVFDAKPAPDAFESDIAVILHPLPRIPILICYWKPDGPMESQLNVFFDDTAEQNLDIDSIYRITTGMVLMFEKVALTHGD